MNQFLRRVHYLLNRRRLDRELAGDLEFHREMAARHSSRPLGNALRLREESRDAWGWTWIERLSQDLRYAGRGLLKSPGFTLAAISILAVGIGVNVAAFGFFDLLVLKPLHVRDPATLIRFHRRSPQLFAYTLPYPEVDFFRQHATTLSAVLALHTGKLAVEGEDKQSSAHFVSANFFSELGATAILGRTFDPARDESPAAEPVVILSQGFWNRHFGADRSVIGKIIRLNGKPATIIGVASSQFSGLSLDAPDLWAPLVRQPWFSQGSRLLTEISADGPGVQMWGRLRDGYSPKAAEAELTALAAELRRHYPNDLWDKETIPGEPGGYAQSILIGTRRGSGSEGQDEIYPIAAMIGALCLMILAVACGNLGSLLLARGISRDREINIRIAVGAGSARLVRQLFTESLLLALLGSAAGLALGFFTLRSLMLLTGAPPWLDALPDWRVALFCAGAGFASAIVFGLTPALQIVRRRQGAHTLRQVLVGAQVAASCVLLIVAGLLVRALNHAASADPGFEYQRVLTLDPGLAGHGYSPAAANIYLDTLQSRILALPGVESVSLALSPPLGNRSERARVDLGGRPIDVEINRVDPRFFHTMSIPISHGRNLHAAEAHAIVISESLARGWPTGDPLGRKFTMGADYTVVGIARSARTIALQNSDSVEVYLPIDPTDLPSVAVLIRTTAPTEAIARSAAALARAIDPEVSPDIQLLKTRFRDRLQGAAYTAWTVSVLGFVALLIACLGIVGLMAFTVAQRTREIGIRMALGAKPSHVLSVVLRKFSPAVLIGLFVGTAAATGLSQILRQQLYGVSNLDPVAYLAAIGVFAITVTLAALLPARRALRIDPARSLRYE
jgi:predicted permease